MSINVENVINNFKKKEGKRQRNSWAGLKELGPCTST